MSGEYGALSGTVSGWLLLVLRSSLVNSIGKVWGTVGSCNGCSRCCVSPGMIMALLWFVWWHLVSIALYLGLVCQPSELQSMVNPGIGLVCHAVLVLGPNFAISHIKCVHLVWRLGMFHMDWPLSTSVGDLT